MAKRAKRIGIRRRQSDEPYSVDYFARKHDISVEQARELMRKIGQTQRSCRKGFSQVDRSAAGLSDVMCNFILDRP